MSEKDKIRIDDKSWANLQYALAKKLTHEAFSNPNLNHKIETSDIVYHYTTLENFISIIENQSFFFTNLNYLNDRKEYDHGVEIILETIKVYEASESKLKILKIVEENLESIYKSSRYIACFSNNGDLLSQWRAYGNQGKGIALGFDTYNINDFADGYVNGMYIEYREELQKNIIQEIIKIILDYFENIKDFLDWGKYDSEFLISNCIIQFLEEFISAFKHPSFSEEKEFRLEYKIDKNINKEDNNKLLFRSNGNLIIPFFKLKYIDKKDNLSITNRKLPLEKIIIGPSVDFKLNKLSIESFLSKNGYNDVKIVQSTIPYRI